MSELPKYVSREISRHGTISYYYRRNGQRTRLRGDPSSQDFLAPVVAGHPNPKVSKVTSFVYFLLYGKRIKIGTCANVRTRLRNLQTGIPGKGRIYYVTPGGRALERELHNLFAADRVTGEWFQYSAAIRIWIKADEDRRAADRGWRY